MSLGMIIPLTILFLGTIFVGYFLKDIFIGMGSSFLLEIIYINTKNFNLINTEFIDIFYKLIPLFISIIGISISFIIYKFYKIHIYFLFLNYNKFFYFTFSLFTNKIFFDSIFNNLIIKLLYFSNYFLLKKLHQNLNIIELKLINLIISISYFLKQSIIQINQIKNLFLLYFICLILSLFLI
jgi:hypothetical protein